MAKITCPSCSHQFDVEIASGPREGSVTHAVYEYVETHPKATRTDALKWAGERGYNPLTVLTQYAAARKHFGLKK